MDINKTAGKIAVILEDKKARDIEILDIKGKTVLADYFVICSGSSETHIRTLCDEVEEKLEEEGLACLHKEGYGTARWILMDYGDIVVHIFHKDEREFYNIERLWSDSVMKHRDTPVK
ncbi:MAG: ribosome silencing factor [Eubacteriales bacterium]|nr:ribosome silencing factor [Eubacteriales bacterium]